MSRTRPTANPTRPRGSHDAPDLDGVLAPLCASVRAAEVDTVVLGCTHYPFVASAIQALLGSETELVDTATAVAERVAVVWNDGPAQASLRVRSTGAAG